MLSCIGDTLGNVELIVGICVSVRKKGDKLAIWTKAGDDDEILKIGRAFKDVCGIPKSLRIEYKTHDDMIKIVDSVSAGRAKSKFSI